MLSSTIVAAEVCVAAGTGPDVVKKTAGSLLEVSSGKLVLGASFVGKFTAKQFVFSWNFSSILSF